MMTFRTLNEDCSEIPRILIGDRAICSDIVFFRISAKRVDGAEGRRGDERFRNQLPHPYSVIDEAPFIGEPLAQVEHLRGG